MNPLAKYLLSVAVFAAAIPVSAQSVRDISEQTLNSAALIMPESAETDTKAMLEDWYLKNYAVIDYDADNADSGDLSDEVIIERLGKLPTVIEMPFNSVVKNTIRYYANRKQLVENMLGLSLYYNPIFVEALERNGMPLELKYLPVIESALVPTAVSRAGAAGLWQFMTATASGLGLEVNSIIDQRRDPYLASDAAAKYLKQLYETFGDWSLAIAAYNCGPGNVNKALRRAGGENKDFWSIYYLLPAETRGYVPAFIAANYVMNYYNQHNISPALAKRPIITDSVHVNKRVHLQQIADILNLPIEEIRVLNPQYRRDVIPGDVRPYSLVLPSMQVYSYIMSEDSILSHDYNRYARRKVVEPVTTIDDDPDSDYVKKLVVKRHVVKKGETLSKIAKRYGVKSSDIKKWNGLRKNSLRAGSTLKINTYERVARVKEPEPETETTDDSSLAATESTQAQDDEPNSGTVQPAETLVTDSTETASSESAAPKAEKPVEKEKTVEKPAPKKSAAKEKTAAKEKAAAKPSYTYHTVKRGETLSKIARKYRGVTIADIQKANGISGSAIQAGQKLKIPRK